MPPRHRCMSRSSWTATDDGRKHGIFRASPDTNEALKLFARPSRPPSISAFRISRCMASLWRTGTGPEREVTDLMGLLRLYLRREINELDAEGVRIRFIGERERLAEDIVGLIDLAERRTNSNSRLNLTLALSYGGRQEITRAARQLAGDVADGSLHPADIDEAAVGRYLATASIPDPDLLIRTSGEKRISNFLLWQSAYAELVFVDTLWAGFLQDRFGRCGSRISSP